MIAQAMEQRNPARQRAGRALGWIAAMALCCGSRGGVEERAKFVERRFSGDEALALVERLMVSSPRTLGDPRRDRAIEALAVELRRRGADEVARLRHEGVDPWSGRRFDLQTLIAEVRPAARERFVVATHFDTRPWAEEDPDPARRESPIPGANDGTSGLAVALTLMPLLRAALPERWGFVVILFDGEELGRPPAEGYLLGSKALGAEMAAGRWRQVAAARFAIVLDLVGGRGAQMAWDTRSTPWLMAALWREAGAIGAEEVFPRAPTRRPIADDHVALIEAGIPAAVLIDARYPLWHTHADSIEALSAATLEAVGEVALRTILRLTAE